METSDRRATYSGYEDDDTYYPLWFYVPRGFVDFRAREAEEFNLTLDTHLPKDVIKWDCDAETGWIFELEELVLEIENMSFEPAAIQLRNLTLPRNYIDPLRQRLRHILAGCLESRHDMKGFAMILLRLLEEAVAVIQEWRFALAIRFGTPVIEKGWDVKHVHTMQAIKSVYENPLGADLDSIDTSGEDILGTSIKEVCGQFPNDYRILHVEPVFRSNLVSRFQKRRRDMYEQMRQMSYSELKQCVPREKIAQNSELNTVEGLAAELCKPIVSFHGTGRHVVSSIVRHGFIKPGEKIGSGGPTLEQKCGASFGIGIYSSPSPEYALWYANMSSCDTEITRADQIPGIRIVVCAVLMGRPLLVTRDETRQTQNIAQKNAHSHVSPNRLEYVVFNSAQIIPCYVVHLDLGLEEAVRRLKEIPQNPNNFVAKPRKISRNLQNQEIWPADKQALKDAKKAAALKWFPYGYGPAKGNSFVIEEIGEISDDEENYGDYQAERVGIDHHGDSDWCQPHSENASWFDEYQTLRSWN